jgi:hypothetical protein
MRIIMITALIYITGCSGSGGGGGTGIQGSNQSGTYSFVGVECYDNLITTSTALALVDTQTDTTLTINGNSAVSQNVSASCLVNYAFSVLFDAEDYTVTYSNRVYTTSNQSSCSLTWGLTPLSGGTIVPSSISATYTHEQTEPVFIGEYDTAPNGDIYFLSNLTVSGSPSDLCFLIYQLQ